MTFTGDDLGSLGTKLDELDLTDGERAGLHAIIEAALPDSEVEGFGFSSFASALSFSPSVATFLSRPTVKDSHDRYG